MVTLVMGRAGSGKTAYIMNEIRALAEKGEKSVLIVPEQFSHEAERQMCALCGNSVCMYSEVLSFSRLSSRAAQSVGGHKTKLLDKGGRVLVMYLALRSVAAKLRVFTSKTCRTEFLENLLSVRDELKSARITGRALGELADSAGGSLGDKLFDLSLILEAYDAFVPEGMADPRDRLEILADAVEKGAFSQIRHVFVDGFTDFTAQETEILRRMIRRDVEITLCLTCDGLDGQDPIFELPRKTARIILQQAMDRGCPAEIIHRTNSGKNRAEELRYLDEHLFGESAPAYGKPGEHIAVYRAGTVTEECELAAALAKKLAREGGYRWRDLAVVANGWADYSTTAANVFEKYGVPISQTEKSDILEKPALAFVLSALDILVSGWDYTSVFRHLKTGLSPLGRDDLDLLENYVIKWNIRGASMWARQAPWQFNPAGFASELSERDEGYLERVNTLRSTVAEPLAALETALKNGASAAEKIQALYLYLEAVDFPDRLERKTEALTARGQAEQAQEYRQLWDILVGAMEQMADILGEMDMDMDEFARVLKIVLSQYDVGTIPAFLDVVGVGDMARMRRRDVKCLIVLGATDERLPGNGAKNGILSMEDRDRLYAMGLSLSDTTEGELQRELGILYASLTMPSDQLLFVYSGKEGKWRPAAVVKKAEQMFQLSERPFSNAVRTAAEIPCLELAAEQADSPLTAACRRYAEKEGGRSEQLAAIRRAAAVPRGRLSAQAAERLYGRDIIVTASRVDKYKSCRFSFFLQYGLRAKPRGPVGFDAPETGTFIHFILENVVKTAEDMGGFGKIDEKTCRKLVRRYVDEYVEKYMDGFADKSGRFQYLFRRLARDAEQIVLDMAGELAVSDFKPLDFELDFSPAGDMEPVEIKTEDGKILISGKVDRVDGWIHDGKLYVRVVDYKTGKKKFDLADVWYGMGLQMLIYLFTLQKHGKRRYGREIVPAGILYAPARDAIIPVTRDMSEADIQKERAKKLTRSGLLVRDPAVIEAMEHGQVPKYLPVKFKKDGTLTESGLATLEQLGQLAGHIEKTLREMGQEMHSGVISADPFYRGQQDNACLYCDYFAACHFNESAGDRRRYLTRLKPGVVWEKLREDEKNGR